MSFLKLVVVMLLMTVMSEFTPSLGAMYEIQNGKGFWKFDPYWDYTYFSSKHNFVVGDIIVFRYIEGVHNVLHVSEDDFNSCVATNPIAVYGSGFDHITLESACDFYFISGVPDDCPYGHMKVAIKVDPAAPINPSIVASPGPSSISRFVNPSIFASPSPSPISPFVKSWPTYSSPQAA